MDFPFYGGSAASPATWGARPATPFVGQRIRCTDLGNKEFYWNGTVWLLIGSAILAQSGAPSSVTGTATETTLASITIPGGMLGANGMLKITPVFSATNNVNTKTMRVRFAGNSLVAQGAASFASAQLMAQIRNRNSLSSQGTFNALNGFGTSASSFSASAVDTSVDQVVTITGTLAVTTDTLTLEGYTVEVLPA